jgi:hypothetical protein
MANNIHPDGLGGMILIGVPHKLSKKNCALGFHFEAIGNQIQAVDCKLIYAIVPNEDYLSLNEILDRKSEEAAKLIFKKFSPS